MNNQQNLELIHNNKLKLNILEKRMKFYKEQ